MEEVNSQEKKTKILIKLIFAGMALFFAGILISVFLPKKKPVVPPTIERPTATPFSARATPRLTPFAIPISDKIEVYGIPLNNFYRNPLYLNKETGHVLFFRNEKYQFNYSPDSKQFIILIREKPFKEIIPLAETEFLQVLGINKKEDACQLFVEIRTTGSVDPDYAGKTFPLSFCVDF